MHAEIISRSEQTRAGLMSAFTQLVFAKGFDKVSASEVAASAKVARSTFYEHFSGTEDVLRACMTRFFAIVADCVSEECEPPELIRVLDHLWSNRRLTDGIFSGHARMILARNQADLVELRLRAMGGSLALPSRLAAIQIAEAQLALIESWMRGRAHCPTEQLARGLYRSSRATALALTA
jgi:AcrR family transcriptional regulator